MTRKKVKLAFITNDSARKATYKKRKNGLLKKVHEISTLCDVDACVIIYSPYEAQPVIWPPSDADVQRVLGLFRRMPEMDQSKKMVNQQTFLRERIVKLKDQLKKFIKDNREKEMVEIMFQCMLGTDMSHLSIMDFNDLAWLIDSFLRDINLVSEKINRAGGGANVVQTNVARPGPVADEEDIKPRLIHGVNQSMVVNPANPAMGAATTAFAFANWPYQVDLVSNYGAPSGYSNQPPPCMIPSPEFNMGGIVLNTSAGATSTNNQPLGINIPGVTSKMMQSQPPQFNKQFLFNSSGAIGSSVSDNPPSGLSMDNNDMIMMAPPTQCFNVGGFVDNIGALSSSCNYLPFRAVGVSNQMMLPTPSTHFNISGRIPPK